MSAGTAGTARPVVLRQSGAVLVPVSVWIFCGAAVVDAVVEGTTGYAIRVAVLMATIAFGAWVVLASPCLVVERDGLRIVNPFRVHWIPFGALDNVTVRGLTTVTARQDSGALRSVTSWNAPGQPRRYAATVAPVVEVVERSRGAWEQRQRGQAAPAVLTTSWRLGPGLVLLALLAADIAIWLR
jgi:hypothetical protein